MGMMFIGKRKKRTVLVDDEDIPDLRKNEWYVREVKGNSYAFALVKSLFGPAIPVLMHRVILKALPDQVVDHINFNGLDNRRSNLRIVTTLQNSWNKRKAFGACSSKYKGVCKFSQSNKWTAKISVNGDSIHLGSFDTELEAAIAYDKAARRYFKEYAATNLKIRLKKPFGEGIK